MHLLTRKRYQTKAILSLYWFSPHFPDQDHRNQPIQTLFNKSNTGFFLTLKALGDYMQLKEARHENIIFITQDSMQFLIGAYIGTKVIKAINSKKIYYANLELTDQIIDEDDINISLKRTLKRAFNKVSGSDRS